MLDVQVAADTTVGPLRALVVFAHPSEQSFNRAVFDRAVAALEAGGHEVEHIDLYRSGFAAAMSAAERRAYESEQPVLDPQVARHIELIRWCEALVFIYPTWWSTMPAIMKGWLERTMVPGVGFTFDERTGKIRASLDNVRRVVGISTYGSSRRQVLLQTDGGRRTLSRALRMSAWRARPRLTWLALYSMDTATDADRVAFLDRVGATLGTLR
jgi:NAD(P)H dehydrogenase (quinone)